jgi:hypothetical protein
LAEIKNCCSNTAITFDWFFTFFTSDYHIRHEFIYWLTSQMSVILYLII